MSPGNEIGLRERKKRETRDALSLATIRLCTERGWAAVTVEDIAAAANVSVRTFRNYFAGKAEAVAGRHVDRVVRIGEELRGRPAAEPLWDAVAEAVQTQFAPPPGTGDVPLAHPSRNDALRLMLTEPALQGELARANAAAQEALAEAVAERTATDATTELYPNLVAAAVGAVIGTAIEHCLRAESAVALVPVLRDGLDRLAAGLPVP